MYNAFLEKAVKKVNDLAEEGNSSDINRMGGKFFNTVKYYTWKNIFFKNPF